MKKTFWGYVILPLLTVILLVGPHSSMARDRMDSLDLEMNIGSRVDQFDWNIAGDSYGNNPNVLSELTWENLEIAEVNGKGRLIMINNHAPFGGMAKVKVNYGEIQSGDNQDSDYEFDNRIGEWSRSNNRADDGSVFDFTTGAGLVFRSRSGKVMVSPLAGYSYHAQYLTIHDGYQTISLDNPFSTSTAYDPPPAGPFAGLDSTYDAVWNSGWIGVDLELSPARFLEIHGFVELHSAEYRAEANWNLRSDLEHPVSFKHESNEAAGVVTGIGAKFGNGPLLVNLDLLYQKWQAKDGIDIFYLNDGKTSTSLLNEVNWESFSVSAGLTVRF